jgi:hypothetical protein
LENKDFSALALCIIAFLAHQIIVLMEPGVIAQLMAGIAEGQKISPGMILFSANAGSNDDGFPIPDPERFAESLVKCHRGRGLCCPVVH